MTMKVLVSDPLSEDGLNILKDAGLNVDVNTGLSEEDLCKIIGDYDALIIRSGTKVTAKVIDAAKNLKVVGRAGVGVDNVDVPAATEKGILVMNTPAANTLSAAEHTCAMIMSLARNIPQAHMSMHKGEWKRSKFTGIELNGKTLGIIGVGRVGSEVARRLKHFNMDFLGYDPYLPKEVADEVGVKLTTLEDVIEHSDIMTIHTPLLPETRGMINLDQFKRMKPNAMLVNVARGGIVVEDDLYTALKDGIIKGAAFDVWEHEPLDEKEMKLLELENLIVTPHLGASTVEAQERVAVEVAEAAAKFLKEGVINNAINAPRGKLDPELAPFLPLAEDLGTIAQQLVGGPVKNMKVIYSGPVSNRDTKRIGIFAVIGVLNKIIGEKANIINAVSIAKSKGITYKESKLDDSSTYDAVEIKLEGTDGKITCVKGTVFAGVPRLTKLNGYTFEMPLQSDIFVARYKDQPGVIGAVGKAFGDNDVNIGQMVVARNEPNGTAMMVLTVDHDIKDDVAKKVIDAAGFEKAKFIAL